LPRPRFLDNNALEFLVGHCLVGFVRFLTEMAEVEGHNCLCTTIVPLSLLNLSLFLSFSCSSFLSLLDIHPSNPS
jgi:hypothetical protein